MNKLLIIGSKESQDQFFKRAQEMGWMQFLSISGRKKHQAPKEIQDLQAALKELRKQPVVKQEGLPKKDASKLIKEVNSLKQSIENDQETIRLLKAEISKVKPLGYFNYNEIKQIEEKTNKKIQFFLARHERLSKIEIPTELNYISREFDFDYFMYIGDGPFIHPAFAEVYIRKDLSELQNDLLLLEEQGKEKAARLKSLAAHIDYLRDILFNKMDLINLEFAREEVDFILENHLFVVEAWIPKNKMNLIEPVIKDLSLICTQVKIENEDQVPTYLENKGFAKIGEDLLNVFDTPSIRDKDPSSWVLWSFAVFFGMIISDAGYGVLFLSIAILGWIRFPKITGIKKRLLKLLTLLSCTTIIWGAMVASYFSIPIKPSNPLNKYSMIYQLALKQVSYHIKHKTIEYKEWIDQYPTLIHIEAPKEFIDGGTKIKEGHVQYELQSSVYGSILMEIALFVGVFHLSLSFCRNLYRSWAGVGWVIAMWGAYLYFPKVLDATSLFHYMGWVSKETAFIVGEQLLYGGLGGAVLLAIIQDGFSGIAAIFKVIEIFADTLSYLRIYALGLASMVLAATFNELGREVGGYIFGALIILFGHMVNISLGTMAGVIHGLRLNFLEWFHHSYEGSGYKFIALRRVNTE